MTSLYKIYITIINVFRLFFIFTANIIFSVFFIFYITVLGCFYYYYNYIDKTKNNFFSFYENYISNAFSNLAISIIMIALLAKQYFYFSNNNTKIYFQYINIIFMVIMVFFVAIFYIFENTITMYFRENAWPIFAVTPLPNGGLQYKINSALSYLNIYNGFFLLYIFACLFVFYSIFKQERFLKNNYIYTIVIVLFFGFIQNFFIKKVTNVNIAAATNIQKQLSEPTGYFSIKKNDKPIINPKTIVFVVIESGGQFISRDENNDEVKMADYISKINNDQKDWIVFDNAVTNSSATEVSVPSFLTGTGIDEDISKLHSMPRLSDIAKINGYERSFFASWFMNWSRLDKFILGNDGFDTIKSAREFDILPINDMGIDDGIAVAAAQDYIESQPRDKPLFVMVCLNALHTPFQAESNIAIPAHIKGRHDRAIYITTAAHQKIFQTLKKTGRYDNSLIMIVGDHGESIGAGVKNPFLARIFNLDEQILKVSFLMKLPLDAPAAARSSLASNKEALVANMDLAPTFAALMGVELKNGLFWKGQNLLDPVPEDRLSVAANVTQWRPHPMTALALVRKNERMVCNSSSGCEYINPHSGEAMSEQEKQRKLNAYLKEASTIPIIRENLAGIRERMAIKNDKSALIQEDEKIVE